jgi:hypothetical protein
MSNKVEICNMALAAIRSAGINSLTEASREAQQCRLHYDLARQFVLRDAQWQFATKVEILSLRGETPLQWLYAYQYPVKCLKIKQITYSQGFGQSDTTDGLAERKRFDEGYDEPATQVNYEILNMGDNKVIATDQQEAYIMYLYDVEDTGLFDPDFVTALVHYLTSLIAIPLTGVDIGTSLRQGALQLYSSMFSIAVANDQNEKKAPVKKLPKQVLARM